MANKYQVSSHLIDQLEILLNKQSSLISSIEEDHSSDSDSFLKEAIVGPDPSTDVPRCNSCNGQLLRGPNSIICVYCGLPQHQHSVPDPISFNSTVAFRLLLNSLHLDPNETVGIPVPGGDRGRGSNKVDEIPLSDFLDLKLKWDDHFRGFGFKDEDEQTGKRFLTLIGVDVEEILSQESGSSITNEQQVGNSDFENEEFKVLGERNFENARTSEVALNTGEGGNDESFADWGAEFQSPTTLDHGHEKSVNISSSDDPSGGNLNTSSSHIWNDTESAVQPVEVKKDSISNEKNDDDDDDSFDDWGDFSMSTTDTMTEGEPIGTAGPATDNSDGLGISDSYNDLGKDIQVQKDNFTVPDNAWNDLIIPSSGGDIPSQINSDKQNGLALLELDDAFLEHQGVLVESTQNKTSEQSDSLGLWGNEIHLDTIGDQIQLKEGEDNSFGLWNGLRGSNDQQANKTEVADSKLYTEGGGSFVAWDDFSGLGMKKNEEQAASLEVVGVKVNGDQSESLGLWNDNSLDEWSDFTGSTGISNSKPIANHDSLGAWNDFSSLMVTRENTRSSGTRTDEDQAALGGDNLFSSWGDFGSSGLQTGDTFAGLNDTKASSDQISFQNSSNSLENTGDNRPIDLWGDFGAATSILEQQHQHASGAGTSKTNLSSGDGDFFSGVDISGKQSTSQPESQLNMFEGNFMDENDDSFAWGDFTTSSNSEANLSSTVNAPTPDYKETGEHGDLLAPWNGIVTPNVQASNDSGSGLGERADSNLFSPNMSSQYVGTLSSMPTVLPDSMFSKQNGSAPVEFAQSGVSDLVGVENGDVKDDGYVEGKNMSESSSKEGMDSKASIAETLISEMHDLSFMLESSLSIPNSGT